MTLGRLGRTQAQIARRHGMTQQGVAMALFRIADGSRAATREPEPVTAAVTASVPQCPTGRVIVVRRGQLLGDGRRLKR